MGSVKALAVTALLGAAAAAGVADERESQIAAYIDGSNDAALELLERVVNINSGSLNLAGVRQVGAIFDEQFQALGFTRRRRGAAKLPNRPCPQQPRPPT